MQHWESFSSSRRLCILLFVLSSYPLSFSLEELDSFQFPLVYRITPYRYNLGKFVEHHHFRAGSSTWTPQPLPHHFHLLRKFPLLVTPVSQPGQHHGAPSGGTVAWQPPRQESLLLVKELLLPFCAALRSPCSHTKIHPAIHCNLSYLDVMKTTTSSFACPRTTRWPSQTAPLIQTAYTY